MDKAFVVAGSPVAVKPWGQTPGPADRVIAADRGAEHARAWGWPIHLLVGDLDSLAPALIRQEEAAGTPLVRVAVAKDQTDTELALAYALAERPRAIVICAALGGRTDHLLANIFLLLRPDLAGRDVVIADGPDMIRLLHQPKNTTQAARLVLHGRNGDRLTLLPIHGDAIGVSTENLRYPLHDEPLTTGSARGISNIFTAEQAVVTLRGGSLLVLHQAEEENA